MLCCSPCLSFTTWSTKPPDGYTRSGPQDELLGAFESGHVTRPRRRKRTRSARAATEPAARTMSWDLRLATAWPEWSGAAMVAVLTFLAFMRVLDNDFVNW